MDSNYISKYSGEQVDAAVEYFLKHSSSEETDYEYSNTIFCAADAAPAVPFNSSQLPITLPEFPFAGTDGNLWYDAPNDADQHWYQCVLKINNKSKKVTSQSAVLDTKGDTGATGTKGDTGDTGADGKKGDKGDTGNYVEFRYHRASSYAVVLTDTQKNSRIPSGWYTDWDTADVPSYSTLKSNVGLSFDTLLCQFAASTVTPSANGIKYFSGVSTPTTFATLNSLFRSIHSVSLVTPSDSVVATIISAHTAFKKNYDTIVAQSSSTLICATEYHRLVKAYVDEDDIWLLFQIKATINGETDSLVGQWSEAQQMQGESGGAGPQGSTGLSGSPGVSISVAFTLGTETAYRSDAADPTASPYNTNYEALFVSGTHWSKGSPTVTDDYPYIWFTQCRYIQASDGTITFEDSWCTPQRYTGKNGISKEETIITRNPIIYPKGIYSATVTYSNDGNSAPYVYYEGLYYYLSGQGSVVNVLPTNTTYWTKLEGFEALYTKVAIISNGLIGSMVFNGDYVFSQQGLNHAGGASSHYEGFLTDYETGESITDPYDDRANFKPNFCLNCKTGEVWSTSRDTAISTASSQILQKANEITLQVKDTINGELSAAGIDITSTGVKVTGKFSGSMDGTFNGDVSAKSLSVLGEDGTPVMRLTTYNSAMGTPEGVDPPAEGTPVLIMSFQGTDYLVSMLTLVSSGGSSYTTVRETTAGLYTATSIDMKTGVQGQLNYSKITAAPYLAITDSKGTVVSKIPAILYDSDGETPLEWKDYLNKYYQGTLIEFYEEKTDLDIREWAFKLVGSLATVSNIYAGRPTSYTAGLYLGYDVDLGRTYYATNLSYYSQISITNGQLTNTSNVIAVCQQVTTSITDGIQIATNVYRYLQYPGTSVTAYEMTGTIVSTIPVTSSSFLTQTTSRVTMTSDQLESSHEIVSPAPAEEEEDLA